MRKCIFTVAALMVCMMVVANGISPLRLHIVANSNSLQDQMVKLEVRDYILQQERAAFSACKNKGEAQAYVRANTEQIEALANAVLTQHGLTYTAQAQVGSSAFPDKQYGNLNYPAGEYDAVRIVLGEGQGENWWCVMFPPLCLVQTQAEPGEEIEYTSLLLTWLQGLFS